MLGFLYLCLIIGWILIILILKCKKSIAPHLINTETINQRNFDRSPSIHVIQIESEEVRNTSSSRERSIVSENNTINFPPGAVTNFGYANDEDFIVTAPPPTYEDVMRRPEIYPKVSDLKPT